MENDLVMAVNKIVITDTKESVTEDDMMDTVEAAVQNKLGDLGNE